VARYMSFADGLDWYVSSLCESGQCIKVAKHGEFVVIGNTNKPEGPFEEFTRDEWRQFIAGAKLGDFDGIA
jgi:Domain of unknown function (DUF397)